VNGSNWTDKQIAEAFDCRTKTVENVRERLLKDGFDITVNGNVSDKPRRAKILDGEQEVQLIAMRLSAPPKATVNGRYVCSGMN